MNADGQSDSSIVPKKQANKADDNKSVAESVEGRELTEGNAGKQTRTRTQRRMILQHELDRVREVTSRDKDAQFTTLWHHVYNVARLREAYDSIKRQSAPGIDGETWEHYGENLQENIEQLSQRLRQGGYRAKPVRRVYIPKADGRKRPIGILRSRTRLGRTSCWKGSSCFR